MTKKAPGKSETKMMVGPFGAKPGRIYVEGVDAIGGVIVNLQTQVLQVGQTAHPPQKETLFLAASAAEILADQLRAAAKEIRRQAGIGDH